jgi:hypothetical protein
MKNIDPRLAQLFLLAMAVAGCSTPDSRIEKHKAEFASYPPSVQTKIRAGEVQVGFTMAMARMALGEPDRIVRKSSADGESEVWIYADREPVIGLGFGFGVSGSHSGTAVGVGTSTGNKGERLRVVFRQGKVFAIETVAK